MPLTYPMEFITAFLNNAQNDDDISNGTELMKVYGVKSPIPSGECPVAVTFSIGRIKPFTRV